MGRKVDRAFHARWEHQCEYCEPLFYKRRFVRWERMECPIHLAQQSSPRSVFFHHGVAVGVADGVMAGKGVGLAARGDGIGVWEGEFVGEVSAAAVGDGAGV